VIRRNFPPRGPLSPQKDADQLSLNVSELWQTCVALAGAARARLGLRPGPCPVSQVATLRCVATRAWQPTRYFSPYPIGNAPGIEWLFREAIQFGVLSRM